jgi:lipopolysaccharide export system permease protein
MASMVAVLTMIFATYSANRYLADATFGLMSIKTVMFIIMLKVLIALEVVLPTSLYLSVIVGLGRLYSDNEMTALFASGVALRRVLAIVFVLSLPVALLGGSLSLSVRPWAYEQFFWLKAKAKAEFDVNRLKAGRFYKIGEGNRFIFIEKIDQTRQRAEGVFMEKDPKDPNDPMEIVYAKEAYQHLDPATGRQVILFRDACRYEIPRTIEGKWRVMASAQYTLSLWPKEITPLEYKTKAASTFYLAHSKDPSDIAELQWRMLSPLSTVLLALLGVPLSRVETRRGKHANLPIGIIIYGFYYSIITVAKHGVQQSLISPWLGIWWVQGLLVVILLILLRNPSQQCWSPSRKSG